MRPGYHGRLLWVDLTSGRLETQPLADTHIQDYVGGKGFGARILYDTVEAGTDGFDPSNLLMFLPGPLTGTLAPSMREVIVFKSPLTGAYGDSFHGGTFGPEIKYAGYDGIVITGRARSPAYLYVDDDQVELRDATFLWGKDTYETYHHLYAHLGDESFKLACIGPAGENLVRFALIDMTPHRQAGRSGGGAVMGSKNLKAIAVRGTHRLTTADPERLVAAVRRSWCQIQRGAEMKGFTELGTLGGFDAHSDLALFPVYNGKQASFAGAIKIDGVEHRKHIWLRNTACMGCVIACSKVGAIRRGPYRGTVCENVEYESQALMGANLGLDHLEGVQYACHLCDVLGLDTISTGGVIGWAMEALERGHLTPADVDNLDLTWGNYQATIKMVEMIAHRQGIGDLLAEGVMRAAEKTGKDSYKYAMHTKGMEMPGYDPRGLPGHGLGYMTGDKGGEHVQGYTVGYEAWGGEWRGRVFDRFGVDGKAELVKWIQDLQVGTNTLVKCDFTKGSSEQGGGTTLDTFAEMLSAVTGVEYTEDDLMRVGERIFNLTRLFNLREGFTREDDDVAYRCRTDPLPDAPVKGRVLTREDLDYMLDDYYRSRGWDEQGVPTVVKLRDLGLEEDGRAQGIV